jgi:hypothetical protein
MVRDIAKKEAQELADKVLGRAPKKEGPSSPEEQSYSKANNAAREIGGEALRSQPVAKAVTDKDLEEMGKIHGVVLNQFGAAIKESNDLARASASEIASANRITPQATRAFENNPEQVHPKQVSPLGKLEGKWLGRYGDPRDIREMSWTGLLTILSDGTCTATAVMGNRLDGMQKRTYDQCELFSNEHPNSRPVGSGQGPSTIFLSQSGSELSGAPPGYWNSFRFVRQ